VGTAQQRLDAQQQFFGMKGLGQVVVGAGLETVDALGPGAARGKDQHRCGEAAGTPVAQHLQPRFARQAEVENDQVIGLAGALVSGVAAIGQPVDGITVAAEAGDQFIGQRNVVFDQ